MSLLNSLAYYTFGIHLADTLGNHLADCSLVVHLADDSLEYHLSDYTLGNHLSGDTLGIASVIIQFRE
jgi:hypothetical protein